MTQQIALVIAPFTEALERLSSIPGIKQHTAEIIVAEVGTDTGRLPQRGPHGELGSALSRD